MLTNRSDHVRPPSVVRKIRDESPMLMANAVLAEIAAMARRSSVAAPTTVPAIHVRPPLMVRITVPFWPLAHATDGDTTLSPRNSTGVPLDWAFHCAAAGWAIRCNTSEGTANKEWRMAVLGESSVNGWREVWSMPLPSPRRPVPHPALREGP